MPSDRADLGPRDAVRGRHRLAALPVRPGLRGRFRSALQRLGAAARTRRSRRPPDRHLLGGNGEEVWEPRFTLHGFRYVQISGLPEAPCLDQFEGRVVHGEVPRTGAFECSNELLNRVHRNLQWTFRTSFQGALQDAGERSERVSWLGDPGFVVEDYLYTFDVAALWGKWLNDIRGSQRAAGDLPVIGPIHWREASWPAWMSTYPLFVWAMHRHYDDRRLPRAGRQAAPARRPDQRRRLRGHGQRNAALALDARLGYTAISGQRAGQLQRAGGGAGARWRLGCASSRAPTSPSTGR